MSSQNTAMNDNLSSASRNRLREDIARSICKGILSNVPGWPAVIDHIVQEAHTTLAGEPHYLVPDFAGAVAGRIDEILRVMAQADPEVILRDYPDLLPNDLRDLLFNKAAECLRGMGVTVVEGIDESGQRIVSMTGLQEAGLPQEMIDQAENMAVQPVGKVHRLQ